MISHIAFRVDAGLQIGTGHVMRCLALADALRAQGVQATFICRPHQGHMVDYIAAQGHRAVLLSPPEAVCGQDADNLYADWLGADWQKDARETAAILNESPASWLVVDHYALDARWENQVRHSANLKIMAIDGQANRTHASDLLLDPTYSQQGQRRWQGLVPAYCRLLVGPQYALLRPEFSAARVAARRHDDGIQRVIVAFGGVDRINATEVALNAIHDGMSTRIAVDIIVGAGNPHYDSLAAMCADAAHIRLYRQPSNVAELMAAADVAVSAGGTMLLEQCFMHLPSLVVGIADNQIASCQALAKTGTIEYLGRLHDGNRPQMQQMIRNGLDDLLQSSDRLARMRNCCRQLMHRPDVSVISLLME